MLLITERKPSGTRDLNVSTTHNRRRSSRRRPHVWRENTGIQNRGPASSHTACRPQGGAHSTPGSCKPSWSWRVNREGRALRETKPRASEADFP